MAREYVICGTCSVITVVGIRHHTTRAHLSTLSALSTLFSLSTLHASQVNALAPNCIAADSGQIRVGQLIYAVNGVEVQDHDAASSLLKAAHGVVELTLSRNVVPDIDEW